MLYDARAVANYFLALSKRDGKDLDPMKVQKLVYFAHGWNLAITGEPLISERVQAWRYGPVIPSVYQAFKTYGNGCIEAPAAEFDMQADSWFSRGWPNEKRLSIEDNDDPKQVQFTRALLDKVWESYGRFSGIQLSNLTHEPGSPWDIVWNGSGCAPSRYAVIGDDIIRGYFRKQSRQHEQSPR